MESAILHTKQALRVQKQTTQGLKLVYLGTERPRQTPDITGIKDRISQNNAPQPMFNYRDSCKGFPKTKIS